MSEAEMIEFVTPIGADIPFFIINQPAFVTGIGEHIKPITLTKKYHYLLINCGKHVSTPQIFKMGFKEFSANIESQDPEDFILKGRNDLQMNAAQICPEILDVLEFLKSQPGCIVSRMSGSGATCFGIFENYEDMKLAAAKAPKNWLIFA